MNRKAFYNLLENVFQPTVNEAMREGLLGTSKATTVTLAAETTLTLDFRDYKFLDVELGSQNITLNASNQGQGKFPLKVGEKVILKITQDAVARTVTFGTGLLSGVTVTASANAVDYLEGMFDGTNIVFGAFAQGVS